jgi:hypothetical protein
MSFATNTFLNSKSVVLSIWYSVTYPPKAILNLRKNSNIEAVCWSLIVLRCFLEIPGNFYAWKNQSHDLSFFWYLHLMYWVLTHPVAMMIGVFVLTSIFYLVAPAIWRLLFLKAEKTDQIDYVMAYLFASMTVIGPLLRFAGYQLSLHIEVLIVMLLMAIGVRLVYNWSWARSILSSAIIEVIWIAILVLPPTIYALLPLIFQITLKTVLA